MKDRSRMRKLIACIGAVGLITGAGAAFAAGPAGAGQGVGNPVLTVSTRSLPAGQTSTITVTGSDYLVPPHAPGVAVFGGVYVLFGWTQPGSWGPSTRNSSNNNGTFGTSYSYPGESADAGTRDDGSGTTRLVSFTPGGDSGGSTAFHMDDNGNWSTTLTVRGSTYQFNDPATGQAKTVNCQQTQCGVYTIGAHGKASSTNERFVPLSFLGAGPSTPVGPAGPGGGTVVPAPSPGGGGTAPAPSGGPGAVLPQTGPGAPSDGTTTTAPGAAGDAKSTSEGAARGRETGTETDPIALTASSSGAGGTAWLWGLAAAVVVAGLGGGAWLWTRRRRASAA